MDGSDRQRVREDAIRLKETDIADASRSVENETRKSAHVLAFIAVILGFFFQSEAPRSPLIYLWLLLLLLAALRAFANMTARRVETHTDASSLFSDAETHSSWERYLVHRYDRIKDVHAQLNGLLERKVRANRDVFILLMVSTFGLVFTKLML